MRSQRNVLAYPNNLKCSYVRLKWSSELICHLLPVTLNYPPMQFRAVVFSFKEENGFKKLAEIEGNKWDTKIANVSIL